MIYKITFLLLLLIFQWSCATGPVHGFLYNDTFFAGEFNPNIDLVLKKKATGCSHQILGIVAYGENGAGTIAFQNKIKKISVIDHSSASFLTIIYRNYCTIIYGE